MTAIVGFDLDGTLFDCDPAINYEDAASVRAHTQPNAAALAIVQAIAAKGRRIVYITGRCTHVRAVTLVQLHKFGFPPGRVITAKAWDGYDAMAVYKAAALRETKASLYVGDHPADRQAAQKANIPFIHADELRSGAATKALTGVDMFTASDTSEISEEAKSGA